MGFRWCHPHAWRSTTACVACNLLADLDGDPARRNVCRVGRLAEHSRSARGASWLAARRPRGDGKARLVMQPVVRPFGTALPALDPPPASASGRGRTTLPIIFNTLSLKVSDEKAVGERTVYRDIHTHERVTSPTMAQRLHMTGTPRASQMTNGPAAPAEPTLI